MTTNVIDRVNSLCSKLLSALGQNYHQTVPEPQERVALAVSRRHSSTDPNPGGLKYARVGQATSQQLIYIANTSESDDEAVARIKHLIFNHELQPPTTFGTPITSTESVKKAIEDEVNKRMQEVLQRLQNSQEPPRPVTNVADVPRETSKPASKPKNRKAHPIAATLADLAAVDLWKLRANALGMKEPKIQASGAIDGRWLRRAQEKWTIFVAHNKLNGIPMDGPEFKD